MDQDDSDSKPVKKMSGSRPKSKDEDHTQTVHIVISTDPTGSGYVTDAGDGAESHPDKSSLMDHLASILPDDSADADLDASDPSAASAAPSPSLMSAVKGMTSK
jgi:hypothetical protein